MKSFLALSGLAAGFALTSADAGAAPYSVSTKSAPTLEIRSQEPESDAFLRAICRWRNVVELRIGAEPGVGQGKREEVKLKIESAGKSGELAGFSEFSIDSEMTGGAELVARVVTDNPVLAVLSSGKPLRISGSVAKPVTVDIGAKAAQAFAAFVKKCGG